MAEENVQSGNGTRAKGKKIGRNKRKCAQYRALHTREKNKIKRVLRSNGETFAAMWAKMNNVSGVLAELLKK